MAHKSAQEVTDVSREETCGRCGATVDSSLDLCPACGALISAYRTPVVTADEVPLPPAVPVGGADLPPKGRSKPLPEPVAQAQIEDQSHLGTNQKIDDESTTELTEARAELLTTLLAPERRLLDIMEIEALVPPATAATPVQQKVKPAAESAPSAKTPALTPVSEKRQKESRPKKPGFVAIGSIEPVVLIGSLIFVIAVLAGLVSTAGDYKPGAAFSLVLGTLGIFIVIFALLVALVRKDQRRR